MTRGATMRGALKHRDFRLSMFSFGVSSAGNVAFAVALAVWLLETTGSPAWVAGATAARFIPTLLASSYGGVIAERFERVRLMLGIDVLAGVVMSLIAVEMFYDLPPAVVVATAIVPAVASTIYVPAFAAMTPQLVPERDLSAANAVRSTLNSVCVIAGPGAGVVLLLLGRPWIAVAANAVTFFFSAACLAAIRTRSTPVDVTEGGEAGALRQMLVGIRTIGASASTAALVGYSVAATFVFGTDTVLFVVVSDRLLGTGAQGYGYLLAGLGLGGILVAPLVSRLETSARLGWVILAGMAGYCLPTLGLLLTHDPVVAVGLQVIRGGSTLVVDVLAMTALQRTVRADRMARVFGAFDSLMLLAVLVGAAVVPPVVAWLGLDATIWLAGLGIPVLCLLGLPVLGRMDRELAVRRAELAGRVSLLAKATLLEGAPSGALDELAAASIYRDVSAGDVVIVEGGVSVVFYVVDSGSFTATHLLDGTTKTLSVMTRGDYFGEIGLLERLPRTATVTATSEGRLLEVEGSAFLDALTRGRPSPLLLDSAVRRFGRTHPGVEMRSEGLATE